MSTLTPPATRSCTVVLNNSAGFSGKASLTEDLEQMLEAGGHSVNIHHVQKGENITDLARNSVEAGCEVVVAGGGDGTINAVASALAGTETSLALLPVGTLNHFARDLNVPLDWEQAGELVSSGRITRVDIGQVNDRHFINNCGLGLYPEYRKFRERAQARGRFSFRAMLSAVISVFRKNPRIHLRFEADHTAISRVTPFVLVANNRHAMERYSLGKRERLNEGKLWVYVMRAQNRFGLFILGLKILFGRFSTDRDFDVFSTTELLVESRRKHLDVSLDGEIVRMHTPLQFRIQPEALRVIVPAEYTEQ